MLDGGKIQRSRRSPGRVHGFHRDRLACPISARTHAKFLLKRPAEVRRIIESPEERDLRDALVLKEGVCQVALAVSEPPHPNPIRDTRSLVNEQAMEMPYRKVHGPRNFRWIQ